MIYTVNDNTFQTRLQNVKQCAQKEVRLWAYNDSQRDMRFAATFRKITSVITKPNPAFIPLESAGPKQPPGWELTGHLQAVLENGDEIRVGLRVVQLLLDQLKHGARALGVHVGLHGGKRRDGDHCFERY